ncbi:Mov34/MPN/PAD-1 family protein [Hazenella coriacea]|uniref:Proteasome lid subunit RPN8/RPN11 n=1 Tax=Hazenella coriacea TaxID=1179467 RepID=A0A4R3LA48_9BACL|nr:M67 family metallopeptidase [Hazenella coriacea]TCS96991.1 proteasome lid subunit RPN8/RPN11 [Hazenella coriacea]
MKFFLSIQISVIEQIRDYCYNCLPYEGYGILAGTTTEITHFFPIPNHDQSPCSFEFDPKVYLETIKQMKVQQLTWIGVIHSHPFISAYPSPRDLKQWSFHHKSFWVYSFKNGEDDLCAYSIQQEQVIPIIYQITGQTLTDRSL